MKNVLVSLTSLQKGFTDTYRHLNGDVTGAYTWWAQRSKTSKINNTGWRIDYWLTSNRIADKVIKIHCIGVFQAFLIFLVKMCNGVVGRNGAL